MKKYPVNKSDILHSANQINMCIAQFETQPIRAGFSLGCLQRDLLSLSDNFDEDDEEDEDDDEYEENFKKLYEDDDEEDDDESQEDQIERLNNQIFGLKENIKYKMQTINQLQKIINRLLECTKKSDSLSTDQD